MTTVVTIRSMNADPWTQNTIHCYWQLYIEDLAWTETRKLYRHAVTFVTKQHGFVFLFSFRTDQSGLNPLTVRTKLMDIT